jgi:hypothetical protein
MERDVGKKKCNNIVVGGVILKRELRNKKEQKPVPCAMCYKKSQPIIKITIDQLFSHIIFLPRLIPSLECIENTAGIRV